MTLALTFFATPPPLPAPSQTAAPSGQLKCRWCAWTCDRWVRERGERHRSGYEVLRQHVREAHAEAFVALEAARRELEREADAEHAREQWELG